MTREGDSDRPRVLMEVSDSMRRNTEIEQAQGSAVGQTVEEL